MNQSPDPDVILYASKKSPAQTWVFTDDEPEHGRWIEVDDRHVLDLEAYA